MKKYNRRIVISLLKSFKKKSLKAKIGIIAAFAVILLLLIYVIYSNFKPEPPTEYDIVTATKGTVVNYLDVNGVVESGYTDNFMAIEGVTVEEVFVNVGDTVKKGDKIATFDVSVATVYVNQAKAEYEKALKEYKDTAAKAETNKVRKAEIEVEIEATNKAIAEKQKEIDELTKEVENNALAILEKQQLNDKKTELLELQAELLELYAEDAETMLTDAKVITALQGVSEIKKAEYEKIEKIYTDMKNGWYASTDGVVTTVNVKAGERYVPVVEEQSSAIDISSLFGAGLDSNTMQIVTALMGGQSAPVGNGITIESYNDLMVTVTVGKSDLLKIKKGMSVIVTSLDNEYEGEVVYVSATATDSSGGLDISSITSMMGGTAGASGAEVQIKIKNADSNVVIGFDVDIRIIIDTLENVLTVPVESVVYNNGVYSVFVYNEADGTVTKRAVTKGLLDDVNYQIVDGLSEGEMVVKSPDPNMEDGTVISKKA